MISNFLLKSAQNRQMSLISQEIRLSILIFFVSAAPILSANTYFGTPIKLYPPVEEPTQPKQNKTGQNILFIDEHIEFYPKWNNDSSFIWHGSFSGRDSHRREETEYKRIINNPHSTDKALQAWERLSCLYIRQRKYEDVQEALQQILSEFEGHEALAKVVDHIGDEFRAEKDYQNTLQLYRFVLQNWPRAEHSISSQVSRARIYIWQEEFEKADEAVEELINNFSRHSDLAEGIKDVADDYIKKRPAKALALYKRLINTWPDNINALLSHRAIARHYIRTGDYERAQAEIRNLLKTFPDNEEIPTSLFTLAYEYKKKKAFDKALALHQKIADEFPNTDEAFESLVNIARYSIKQGDVTQADDAVSRLLKNYLEQRELSRHLYDTAKRYHKAAFYYRANNVCRKILEEVPGYRFKDEAKYELARTNIIILILSREDEQVEELVDNFIKDFKSRQEMPRAVFGIGKLYYELGGEDSESLDEAQKADKKTCNEMALKIWDRNIQQLAGYGPDERAYYFSAEVLMRLAEQDKALEYYDIVARNWPNYNCAAVNLQMAKIYRDWLAKEEMLKSDALPLIKNHCKAVIEYDSDSPQADEARRLLSTLTDKN